MTERAVPILPSRDLHEALAFYQRLGFENRGAPPDDWDYVILARGDVELHLLLVPDVDPLTTAGSCYVYVDDAEALAGAWQPLVRPDPLTGSRFVPGGPTAYDMWEFAVVDPSGNLVRVGSCVTTT